jgi:hypothetical protein
VTFSQLPDFLLISQAAAAAFAGARLLHFHLRRRFPFLLSYLLVIALVDLVLSILPLKSKAYYYSFIAASPLAWCAAAMAVFEMFVLIFRDYPGLRTAGRWALNVALALSLIVSFSINNSAFPGESARTHWLFDELILDRSIHFSLAVVIIILMVFLSRYPLHLERNTYVATGFFSAMFLAEAAVRLVDTLTPHLFAHKADDPELGFVTLCFLGCGIALRSAQVPVPARIPVNRPKEAELLQQLESLNDILSRSVRR